MRSSRGEGSAGAAGVGVAAAGGRGRADLAATFAGGFAFFADARLPGAFLAGRFLAAADFLAAVVLRRAAALVTLVFLRFVFALALAFRLVAMTASQLE